LPASEVQPWTIRLGVGGLFIKKETLVGNLPLQGDNQTRERRHIFRVFRPSRAWIETS
jgi:hypothetical protein